MTEPSSALQLTRNSLPYTNAALAEGALILGTGPLGRATAADLLAGASQRRFMGYLSFPGEAPGERAAAQLKAPVLGSAGDLEAILRKWPVEEVYLSGSAQKQGNAMQAAISTCERFGVPFALPAFGFRLNRANALNQKAVSDGYLHFSCCEPKPLQLALKRVFDVLASAAALVLLAPLFLLTTIAMKLTMPGPVFFRQTRCGLQRHPFQMLKFRSMVVEAESRKAELQAQNEQSGPVFKIRRDPRVTPLGRFLRKYSIDELPQLINVLRGEMSLVGPRPPVPDEVERYEPWQRRRLSVRPGLTCLWQVSGRNQISFKEWMMMDMRYIDHWSLIADFDLIMRTVPVVLTGHGAS
jgi:exopolysaccharide biosynthesis polyprenyl glycosylphosphotransferase